MSLSIISKLTLPFEEEEEESFGEEPIKRFCLEERSNEKRKLSPTKSPRKRARRVSTAVCFECSVCGKNLSARREDTINRHVIECSKRQNILSNLSDNVLGSQLFNGLLNKEHWTDKDVQKLAKLSEKMKQKGQESSSEKEKKAPFNAYASHVGSSDVSSSTDATSNVGTSNVQPVLVENSIYLNTSDREEKQDEDYGKLRRNQRTSRSLRNRKCPVCAMELSLTKRSTAEINLHINQCYNMKARWETKRRKSVCSLESTFSSQIPVTSGEAISPTSVISCPVKPLHHNSQLQEARCESLRSLSKCARDTLQSLLLEQV